MKRNSQFLKRKIGTEFVIIATGEATRKFSGMISINETGSFIWDLLAEEITLDDVVRAITAEYEVPKENARQDAERFIGTLTEVGAVIA